MELGKRTLTAVVLLGLLFAVIQYLPPLVFFILTQAVVAAALFELYALASKKKLYPRKGLGLVLALALSVPFYLPRVGLAPVLFGCLLAACVYYVVHIDGLEKLAVFPQSMSVTFFGALYLGFSLNHLHLIRVDQGPAGLYFLFAVIFLGDTGAFFIGKPLGRHKMTPIASPNKSWEGSAGGILFAGLGAIAARALFYKDLGLGKALLVAVLVHAAAQVADPLESLFKRAAGVKDSSNILPGHGGFLDRVDSLILAAPLFYYLVRILWK